MSNLSGLPPSALVRAASLAATGDVAVRLINLPDSLKSNAGSLTLSGTVIGQNKDGSLNINTDHGTVTILLKDRGALPAGQKIEIDIPAGRPPQQAAIRQAPIQGQPPLPVVPPPSTAPPLSVPLPPPLKLDRDAVLRADDIAEALAALPLEEIILPAAPLQAGQIVRLLPLPNTPTSTLPTLSGTISAPEQPFINLVNLIIQAPDIPQETKQNFIQILSRIDPASLLPQTATIAQPESQEIVQATFQKLAQAFEFQTGVKLPNVPLQNIASTLSQPINPAKPLDVKILAFQTPLPVVENFETVLSGAPSSPASPAPALPQGNFVAAPQIQSQIPAQPQTSAPLPQHPAGTSLPAQALQQPQSTPQPPTQLSPLLGQVAGFTSSGQPIITLNLPNGAHPHLYVAQFAASNIAVGAPVIVEPIATAPLIQGALQQTTATTQAPITLGADQSLADWATGGEWTMLQTLITSLTHLNPALAQPLIQMMPSATAPQNFGALSLFILSVMRSGDIENWLDEPVMETLKQSGKLDILRALTGESAMMSKLETAALPNAPHSDWKATMLPFWHQGQVNKLPLYFKKWNDDSSNVEGVTKKTTRFLFNLKFSRMGDVQVDGFVQKEKMDMILRTKASISPSMQQAIRATYTKAMERSNFAGEITFQFKPEQWVEVEKSI